jgi:hypothetical protein
MPRKKRGKASNAAEAPPSLSTPREKLLYTVGHYVFETEINPRVDPQHNVAMVGVRIRAEAFTDALVTYYQQFAAQITLTTIDEGTATAQALAAMKTRKNDVKEFESELRKSFWFNAAENNALSRHGVRFLPPELRQTILLLTGRTDITKESRTAVLGTDGLRDSAAFALSTEKTAERHRYPRLREHNGCVLCGQPQTHLPCPYENYRTRTAAARLAELLRDREVYKGDRGTQRGYMLGIMELNGRLYAAISGKTQTMPPEFKRTLSEFSSDIALITSTAKNTTAGGLQIAGPGIPNTYPPLGDDGTEPFCCSAQKLVFALRAELLKAGSSSKWYLTEIWCGPAFGDKTHGVIYPSCAICTTLLPYMLCLATPKEHKKV